MSLKAKVEAIIYAAEEPITLEQISLLLKDAVLADLAAAKENAALEQGDSDGEAATNTVVSKLSEAQADSVEADTSSSEAATVPEAGIVEEGPEPEIVNESTEQDVSVDDATSAEPVEERIGAQPDSEETLEKPQGSDQAETQIDGPQEDSTIGEAVTKALEGQPESAAHVQEAPDGQTENEPVAGEPATHSSEPAPAESASVGGPETTSRKRVPKKTDEEIAEEKTVRNRVREILIELVTDYASETRGMEIRQVAGGFRMATKPEHHDVVRAFAKSLKPPIRLSLAALETLAVVAYKQPITGPEIADIRGVESASVLGTLLDRKLITTAGRKQVIGRPMQYKTSKDFLMRFGLNDVNELPSMEEFSSLAFEGAVEVVAPAEPQESAESQSLFESDAKGTPEQETAAVQLSANSETEESGAEPDAPEPQSELKTQNDESSAVESKDMEPQDAGSPVPETHPSDEAEAADSQPQSEADSSNEPEAERPIGQ